MCGGGEHEGVHALLEVGLPSRIDDCSVAMHVVDSVVVLLTYTCSM